VAAVAAGIVLPAAAFAATLVVDDDGTYDAGTNGCDGADAAYATINAANTAAVDGDTIFVCPGTYVEVQINVTKALIFQGSGASSTIIDGGGGTGLTNAGTVRIRTNTGNVTVDGFTIQNPAAQGASATGLRFGISAKSSAAVTYMITNNVIKGTNNPTYGSDYGVYTDRPTALETFIFQYNTIMQTGSNPILIERHVGPTDVSYNTFDRGIRSLGISAYFNMSHSGTVVTSLQRVSNNVINMANDPGPYTSSNASSGIVFNSAFTGTTVGRFTNVEISGNVITGLESFRRGIVIANGANVGLGANGEITGLVISCNTLSGPAVPGAGSIGIRMLGQHAAPDIRNNRVADVETGFLARDNNGHIATGITLNENHFSNIGLYAIDWWSNVPFDAEYNWFDDASGPTDPGNPSGDLLRPRRLGRVRRRFDLRSDQRLLRPADQRRRRVRRRPVLQRHRHLQRRHLLGAHRRPVCGGSRVRRRLRRRGRHVQRDRGHPVHRGRSRVLLGRLRRRRRMRAPGRQRRRGVRPGGRHLRARRRLRRHEHHLPGESDPAGRRQRWRLRRQRRLHDPRSRSGLRDQAQVACRPEQDQHRSAHGQRQPPHQGAVLAAPGALLLRADTGRRRRARRGRER